MRNRVTVLLLVVLSLALPLQAREVVDMAGRRIELPQKIERVVTSYRVATDMVFALQVPELLVGVSYPPTPILLQVSPAMKKVGIANRHCGLEDFLRLKPDMVFMQPGPLVERLAEVGIRVYVLKVEDPDSMVDGLLRMGEILGKKDHAERLAAYYRRKLEYIKQQTADISPRRSVYLIGPHGIMTTVGGDFYQDPLIRYAGGINVAHELKGGWAEVSPEQIIAWNPDAILRLPYSDMSRETILKNAALSVLDAVKAGRLHEFPSYIDAWDLPTPESILGMMWLAQKLYPEQVAFDMRGEAAYFYREFYGAYPQPVKLD